jgi:DNA-nicking Smr family endonuclease
VVTGKGLHSQGDPVLHPNIKNFLESNGHKIKTAKDQGKIDVIILI